MCGVVGFLTSEPKEENFHILGRLLLASDVRGKDSTGICYYVEEEDGFYIEKQNVEAEDFIKTVYSKRRKELSKTHIALGHTRTWTTGRPENLDNDHPIYSKNFILTHNGQCVRTPKIDKYKYAGEVDSEFIIAQIETKGIKKGLEHCTGTAALAFIDIRKHKELLLYRETNPIWLAHKPGEPTVFFASTDDILAGALDETVLDFFHAYLFRKLPENELWKVRILKDGKLSVKMVREIEYEKHKPDYSNIARRTNYPNSYFGDNEIGNKSPYESANLGRKTEGGVSKAAEVLVSGNRYEWVKYFSVDEHKMIDVTQFNWQWWPEAKCWHHRKERLIKKYIREHRRCEIATPNKALNMGWIKKLPSSYKEKSEKGNAKGK